MSTANDELTGRKRSTRYPQLPLGRCEELARVVYGMGARRVHVDRVAEALGYKSAQSGAFLSLKAAASYFGLVDYDGPQYLSLPQDVISAFHSGSEEELRQLRRQALRRPALYQKLLRKYEGKQLPPVRRLEEELFLFPEYGLLKDAARGAARAFVDSLKHAGALDANGFLSFPEADTPVIEEATTPPVEANTPPVAEPSELPGVGQTRSAQFDKNPAQGGKDIYDIILDLGQRARLELPPFLTERDRNRLKAILDTIPSPSPTAATIPDSGNRGEE